jgi:DNA topoisomerase II
MSAPGRVRAEPHDKGDEDCPPPATPEKHPDSAVKTTAVRKPPAGRPAAKARKGPAGRAGARAPREAGKPDAEAAKAAEAEHGKVPLAAEPGKAAAAKAVAAGGDSAKAVAAKPGAAETQAKRSRAKKRTGDELYTQLSEREMVLKRPDTYVGNVHFVEADLWCADPAPSGGSERGASNRPAGGSPAAGDPKAKGSDPKAKGSEPKAEASEPKAEASEPKGEASEAPTLKDSPPATPASPAAASDAGDAATEPDTASVGSKRGRGDEKEAEGGEAAGCGFQIVRRKCRYVPALLKIADEILVNAADAAQNDPTVTQIRVEIDRKEGSMTVHNNGAGIPVDMHTEGQCYTPEFIFGRQRVSSNYDDDEERITGGRNGLGAKCTNIFSTRFCVDIHHVASQQRYRQTWSGNMAECGKPRVAGKKGKRGHVRVQFWPDFARFGGATPMATWDDDIVALIARRAHDLAATCGGRVRLFFDGAGLPVRSLTHYMALFAPAGAADTDGAADAPTSPGGSPVGSPGGKRAKGVQGGQGGGGALCARLNAAFEVGVATNARGEGLQQMSFVNNIWTSQGGPHVDAVAEQLVAPLREAVAKRLKAEKLSAKAATPKMIREHLLLFVNATLVNPTFETQSKDVLSTPKSEFRGRHLLSEAFIKKVVRRAGVVERVADELRRQSGRLLHRSDGAKGGDHRVDKFEDASAPARERSRCTLILTEGDSAKALVMSSLSAVGGRRHFGVFPLKGKLVNPRDASLDKIAENAEFKALKKIIGLRNGEKYTQDSLSKLRFGRVWIFADSDVDGAHITALVANLFEHYWPELVRVPGFLNYFVTPLIKARRRGAIREFFGPAEYHRWRRGPEGAAEGWTVKWYKGLGTSSAAEGKEYLARQDRHVIPLCWSGDQDHAAFDLAFGKANADRRKEWLDRFLRAAAQAAAGAGPERDEEGGEVVAAEAGRDAIGEAQRAGRMTYSTLIHRQLILYSVENNVRHLPSVLDGLLPVNRKILFVCILQNQVREIKVASLAGAVIARAAYEHGEASCAGTIVKMAQDYVGSNNLPLLFASGQFGTRAAAGANAASPRYINTFLAPITRTVFAPEDDAILAHLTEEGKKIEPVHYLPVIPMILANERHEIGTGYSTSLPCFSPADLVAALLGLLDRADCQTRSAPWTASTPPASSPGGPAGVLAGAASTPAPPGGAPFPPGGAPFPPDGKDGAAPSVAAATPQRPEAMEPLVPWVRGFRGTIVPEQGAGASATAGVRGDAKKSGGGFRVRGCWTVRREEGGCAVHITELPFDLKQNDYLERLETLRSQDKISSFTDESEETISITVRLSGAQLAKVRDADLDRKTPSIATMPAPSPGSAAEGNAAPAAEPPASGLVKLLRLETRLSVTNMVAFDSMGGIRRYASANEILEEFFWARLPFYSKRKAAQLERLRAELSELSAQARFCLLVATGQLAVTNQPDAKLHELLQAHKFPPVVEKRREDEAAAQEEAVIPPAPFDGKGPRAPALAPPGAEASRRLRREYNYLLKLPIWSLTMDKVDKLKREEAAKGDALRALLATRPTDMWRADLRRFLDAWHVLLSSGASAQATAPAKKASAKPHKAPAGTPQEARATPKKRPAPADSTPPNRAKRTRP